MGRSTKKGVDYFPHDTDASERTTLFALEAKYKNDGYAFWFKLLEILGKKENAYVDCTEMNEWFFLLHRVGMNEQQVNEILDLLADLKAIDSQLWKQRRIIWSDNFVGRLEVLYKKRRDGIPQKPTIEEACDISEEETAITDTEKPISDAEMKVNAEETAISDTEKPKRKRAKKAAKPDVQRTAYAENVTMTEDEHAKLIQQFGKAATDFCIEKLDNYKGSSGKTYNSDYRAILSWVVDDAKKKRPDLFRSKPQETADSGKNPFEEYMEES